MRRTLACFLLLATASAHAAEPELPKNFIEYEPGFASSGQPTPAQLVDLAKRGYERIVYLAFSDHKTSLEGLDRHAENAGLQYVQIPVVWDAPSAADYALFAAVMKANQDQPTLVHCQVNFRASAFAFLHRVIEQGVPVAQAKADMNRIWTPTAGWNEFLFAVLKAHDIDPQCEGCDWTPWDPKA
ncbi:MAG: protein tyrosine phosphatase family protein [Pseudomonadota bacterium]